MGKRLGLNDWWAIVRTRDGFVFPRTMCSTRSLAIEEWNGRWSVESRMEYWRAARRGEVRAMRVTVEVSNG